MKPVTLLSMMAAMTAFTTAQASVIVTYAEKPDAMNSSLSNTAVFDFNTLPVGIDKKVDWAGVGSFDQLNIKNADVYGGATDATNPNGTRYSVQGVGSSVGKTTLSLNASSSYFGMWWSAGDPWNVLDFYSGNTLIGEFTTASLMDPLPAEYDGNPRNRRLDSGEPFAFINFFGDEKTSWDSIVLRNAAGSGFEADNFTSRVTAWDPLKDGALPGVPVTIVEGTKTKAVTKESLAGTRWAATPASLKAAPGAPAPPAALLAVFGLVAAASRRKQKLAAA